MIKITLPDGSVREYEKGTTAMQVATSISEGLARNVLAAKLNSVVVDANTTINENSTLSLLKHVVAFFSSSISRSFRGFVSKRKVLGWPSIRSWFLL